MPRSTEDIPVTSEQLDALQAVVWYCLPRVNLHDPIWRNLYSFVTKFDRVPRVRPGIFRAEGRLPRSPRSPGEVVAPLTPGLLYAAEIDAVQNLDWHLLSVNEAEGAVASLLRSLGRNPTTEPPTDLLGGHLSLSDVSYGMVTITRV